VDRGVTISSDSFLGVGGERAHEYAISESGGRQARAARGSREFDADGDPARERRFPTMTSEASPSPAESMPGGNTAATAPDAVELTCEELIARAHRLYQVKQYAAAAEHAGRAARLHPDDPELWNAQGVFYRAGARSTEAVWSYRRALALAPRHAAYWSNLGNALKDTKQVEAAVACQRRAIELAPRHSEYHENLALALMAGNRHEEALAAFDEASRLRPDLTGIRFNRAMAALHLGDYGGAWPDYEVRLLHRDNPRPVPGERWAGQAYPEKRLLVVCEQGMGDALWAARYFRQAKALGGELIVECHEPLLPLIKRMPEVDEVLCLGETLPAADFHVYLCSLPGFFTRDIASIPAEPYIAVPTDRTGKFRPAMQQAGDALRVGIIWSGNMQFLRNKDRAIPLQAFVQAFALPGVRLYSLQKGPLERDLKTLTNDAGIIDLAPLIDDFVDTAAAVSQLDLVIMTDSSTAHLCGAMGRPIWLLLGYVSFWLWLLDRADSPWYPSMRLFRQRAWGDWGGIFDAATAELLRLSFAGKRA
jgi:tetratricopeptide (TPR) repeat protein